MEYIKRKTESKFGLFESFNWKMSFIREGKQEKKHATAAASHELGSVQFPMEATRAPAKICGSRVSSAGARFPGRCVAQSRIGSESGAGCAGWATVCVDGSQHGKLFCISIFKTCIFLNIFQTWIFCIQDSLPKCIPHVLARPWQSADTETKNHENDAEMSHVRK